MLAPAGNRETFGKVEATFLKDEIIGSPMVERVRTVIELVNDRFDRPAYLLKCLERATFERALENANAVFYCPLICRCSWANGIGQRIKVLAEC